MDILDIDDMKHKTAIIVVGAVVIAIFLATTGAYLMENDEPYIESDVGHYVMYTVTPEDETLNIGGTFTTTITDESSTQYEGHTILYLYIEGTPVVQEDAVWIDKDYISSPGDKQGSETIVTTNWGSVLVDVYVDADTGTKNYIGQDDEVLYKQITKIGAVNLIFDLQSTNAMPV